jgi:hypothetical protein
VIYDRVYDKTHFTRSEKNLMMYSTGVFPFPALKICGSSRNQVQLGIVKLMQRDYRAEFNLLVCINCTSNDFTLGTNFHAKASGRIRWQSWRHVFPKMQACEGAPFLCQQLRDPTIANGCQFVSTASVVQGFTCTCRSAHSRTGLI